MESCLKGHDEDNPEYAVQLKLCGAPASRPRVNKTDLLRGWQICFLGIKLYVKLKVYQSLTKFYNNKNVGVKITQEHVSIKLKH